MDDGLSKLVRYLVETDRPECHNHATIIFQSLAQNKLAHQAVVKSGLLSLLLVLRNSKDLDSRRVSLDALLDFIENRNKTNKHSDILIQTEKFSLTVHYGQW